MPGNPFVTRLRATWQPAMYHGHGKRHSFFEGWYYKIVDASEQHVYAIIPGVFLGQTAASSHAFIQVLDGRRGQASYQTYPLDQFAASETGFDVQVGANHFCTTSLSLATDSMAGTLSFAGITPWPVSLLSPGIMGWYAFAPFMECYHGVVSLDHRIEGVLTINKQAIDFSGGRGYIEKDWGEAFPQAWVWMQSNHFGTPGVSLSASVATIPWLGAAFRGFIVGLLHAGTLYRFATYSGATLRSLRLTDTHVFLSVESRQHRLDIEATRSEGGLLHAPVRVEMDRRVVESLTAQVQVRLSRLADGACLFAGSGKHTGLETSGALEQILDGG